MSGKFSTKERVFYNIKAFFVHSVDFYFCKIKVETKRFKMFMGQKSDAETL